MVVNFPRQRTAFIGRQHDLEAIATQLNDPACQLLTLTGPGGVGKTRLALEVAAHLHDTFADGVVFMPLAPLTSADDVLTATINALTFQPNQAHDPQQQLLDYLSTKQLLLVMDNFEHLLEGVTLVNDIIDTAAQVKVLVTSREPLNLQEEWVWRVQGMAVPEQDSEPIEDYSAVQLFVDRAQRVQRDFSLDDEREHVIHICQLVEGLPLALEMSAAWLKSLPCQAIADQIERNIDFLTTSARNAPDRHRSMRAVFDHSWQLLSEDERTVFARLSVFRGGFTIDAADQVAGATLANLTALADKSLIQPGTGQRYDLHELLRQYGDERLADDRDTRQTAHATYFAHFLSQREADLKGRRQQAALDEIAADHENMRTAWLWAVQANRYDLVNEMVFGTSLYFYMSDSQEIGQLRTIALTHFLSYLNPTDPNLWPLLLICNYGLVTSDDPGPEQIMRTIVDQVQQTLVQVESQGEQALLAYSLKYLGHCYEAGSDFENAIHYYEQSLAGFQQSDEQYYVTWMLTRLGACYMALGQWDQGYQNSRRGLMLGQEIGNTFHAARALYNLGTYALYHACELAHAHHDLGEVVKEQHDLDSPMGVALATVEIGYMAFLQGNIDTATRLVTDVMAIADKIRRLEIHSAALTLQALLAALSGDNITGRDLAMQSLDDMRIQYPITVFWAQMALNMTVHGQNKPGESQQSMDAMLHQASQVQSPLLYACCLPFSALMFAHERQPERAIELLALAFTHLSDAAGWMERWQPIVRLRQQLSDELGAEAFAGSWDRGAQLNLDITIADLSGHTDDGQGTQPGLIEPLSERELEILELIAEDLSNREIAERLYITVGTVKSHNNHIFSKFGVKNRTEAIIHARTLGLL